MERYGEDELKRALAESESRFRCLIECAGDAYLLYDERGRVRDVNPSACEAFGYGREELTTLSVGDLVDGDVGTSGLTPVDGDPCAGQPQTLEITALCKDGEAFPAVMRIARLESNGDRFFVALVRDVTERQRAERQLEYLGGHDGLTGLPNRRLFMAQLQDAVERARRGRRELAVLHVDLDRFRLINQALGPDAADDLLREVGSRLREAAGAMDLVARHTGDEFLLLVADAEPDAGAPAGGGAGAVEAADAVARRIHEALRRPFSAGRQELYVDARVGVSVFPLDADEPDVLLRHADAAADQAKRPGEGPTKLFAGETSDKWARLWLAARLRMAVEREELVLHYQPIVDLRSMQAPRGANGGLRSHVVAYEALVRWRDKDGLVPPPSFIPLAEDMGLIDGIGNWVFREACRQAREWVADGVGRGISLNVSLQELWQPHLGERLHGQVLEAGLDPRLVTVEITESSAMTDPVRTRRVLGQLRGYGFQLAIDDFGAGHSSLARLSELPCQILKIDRSFISRLPEEPSVAAMVTAMVELARSLGMEAVAEGIETQEQLDLLVERGCPLGQGYLFSRPLAAADVARL